VSATGHLHWARGYHVCRACLFNGESAGGAARLIGWRTPRRSVRAMGWCCVGAMRTLTCVRLSTWRSACAPRTVTVPEY